MRTDAIVSQLSLQPHPEGGYYREIERALPPASAREGYTRSAYTSIFYYLERGDFSSFHRIDADELWAFHGGAPLRILRIDPQGQLFEQVLGLDFSDGQSPQYVVPSGDWFAAAPVETALEEGSLVSCIVVPGFEFVGFELAKSETLCEAYPQHQALIRRFTRA